MFKRVKWKIVIFLSVLAFWLIGVGLTMYPPVWNIPPFNVWYIKNSPDIRYIFADNYIRFYDSSSNKFVKKIEYPLADEKKWLHKMSWVPALPYAFQRPVFEDKQHIILQAASSTTPNAYIYTFLAGETRIEKIGAFPGRLVGVDQDYFYALETLPKGIWRASRYSRELDSSSYHHFDKNPELIVIDIWEDSSSYWYLCFRIIESRLESGSAVLSDGRFSTSSNGKIYLMSRSKTSSSSHEYETNDDNMYEFRHLPKLVIFGDSRSIWTVGYRREKLGYSKQITKFSKINRVFTSNKIPNTMEIIPWRSLSHTSDYLWGIEEKDQVWQIYRINKKTLKITPSISFAKNEWINFGHPMWCDQDTLWITVKSRENMVSEDIGPHAPYILKISQEDMRYEFIPLELDQGEKRMIHLGTIARGFAIFNPLMWFKPL
jgi:hypothetical protein